VIYDIPTEYRRPVAAYHKIFTYSAKRVRIVMVICLFVRLSVCPSVTTRTGSSQGEIETPGFYRMMA